MSNEKQIKSRIQQKMDTSANWKIAGEKGFVPLKGEIIVYMDDDGSRRIKVGDSSTNVNDLPFVSTDARTIIVEAVWLTVSHTYQDIKDFVDQGDTVVLKDNENHLYNLVKIDDAVVYFSCVEDNYLYKYWINDSEEYPVEYSSVQLFTYDDIPPSLVVQIEDETSSVYAYEITGYASNGANVILLDESGRIYHLDYVDQENSDPGMVIFSSIDNEDNKIFKIKIEGIQVTRWTLELNNDQTGVQSDWEEADENADNFIQNKPAITSGEGEESIVQGTMSSSATGFCSYAGGDSCEASGGCSYAFGSFSYATGTNSHAEGNGACSYGDSSHAEGIMTTAKGDYSHAEGMVTWAIGENSHTEGEGTHAFGRGAHAEGYYSFTPINWRLNTSDSERKVWTYGQLGTAEVGDFVQYENAFLKIKSIDTSAKTITLSDSAPGFTTTDALFYYYGKINAHGDYSHAEGEYTRASGIGAHAEGYSTNATGNYSHAEGGNTSAIGIRSHAEGTVTTAEGNYSHAEGRDTVAYGYQSHAEGLGRWAIGVNSHSEGKQLYPVNWRIKEPDSTLKIWKYDTLGDAKIGDFIGYNLNISKIISIDEENKTITLDNAIYAGATNIAVQFFGTQGAFGRCSHVEGEDTGALQECAHAEGYNTIAADYYTHAEGTETKAQGPAAHAEGARTIAFGNSSHAEGSDTLAYGVTSHAEGDESKAIGNHSHAEGFSSKANGEDSHAEGYSTIADGINSHAENDRTQATGASSHAEGVQTKAAGKASHAEGILTLATGENSHAEGYYTNAQGLQSHAEGQGQRTELLKVDTTDEPKKYYYYGDNEYLFVEVGNTVSSEVSGVTTTVTSIDIENKFIYTQDDLFPAPHEIQTETLIQVALFEGKASGEGAHSEGYCTTASARGAHSEGGQTDASGDRSHAEGGQTTASGLNSHAEGWHTLASGNDSHAEGNYTEATASYSHAEGYLTKATGTASHAEGYHSYTKGVHSHAEGEFTTTEGLASHAEGYSTYAKGLYSHAEGCSAVAEGAYSHAEGWSSEAKGTSSHAEGTGTTANGHASHAEGHDTEANGDDSHAEGWFSIATGVRSHAEGYGSEAIGDNSHAEGYSTESNGANSHAEGHGSKTNGINSHAEGYYTTTNAFASHAEGDGSSANGYASHAEGSYTKANGLYSHAEGDSTIAQGVYSHAEGLNTKANGDGSHAEGRSTIAKGASSHAEGINKEPDEHLYISSTSGYSTVCSVDGNPWTSCVVVNKDGESNYGFKLESDGYYKSQNFGIKESYALSQVQLDMVKSSKIYIHVRVDCESSDAIFFSKLDTPFTASAVYENGTQARLYGKDYFTTVEYYVPAGKHTIDIKYRKDANGDEGKDQAEFRILSYTLNEAYIGKILSYKNSQAKIINVNTSTNTITLNEPLSLYAFSGQEVAILSSGALEEASHTEGYSTIACQYSHAEGEKTVASGQASHAEGNNTRAAGINSHSEGFETRALGEGAHVEGYRTYATGAYSHVEGRYNEIDQKGDYAHIVGIGTSPSDRRNGHAVDWKGNGTYAGMVTANGGLTLASGTGYGQDIPEDADEGRIFFMPDNTANCIVSYGQVTPEGEATTWYYEEYESGLVKVWGARTLTLQAGTWKDLVNGVSEYNATLSAILPFSIATVLSETFNITNHTDFTPFSTKSIARTSSSRTNQYRVAACNNIKPTGNISITINFFVLGWRY